MASSPPFSAPSALNLTTSAHAGSVLPPDYGQLVVQPSLELSIAAQVSTIVSTSASTFRIPVVCRDPLASWTSESQEIIPSDALVDEIVVRPAKLAALSIISSELADDSSPSAASIIGAGLARDSAGRMDQAFFRGLPAPAPGGLESATGFMSIDGAGAFEDLDAFAAAIAGAEESGGTTTHFVAHPQTVLALAKIKTFNGSNSPLLGQDATAPGMRRILGVPLLSSRWVEYNAVWAVDKSSIIMVLREDSTVETDRSVYFSSDRVAIRSIMRLAWAFTAPSAIVRITRPPIDPIPDPDEPTP